MEDERERTRKQGTEELLKRAREEMESKISRALEEEIERRMDELQARRDAAAAVAADRTAADSSFGQGPAHGSNSEVKKRLEALALWRADVNELGSTSSKAKKYMTSAFLNVARQYHDKRDWRTGLVFYRHCHSFARSTSRETCDFPPYSDTSRK
ncbi:hypothetical protein FRB90_005509 [Tulasnella sp. 427]|nr:hypothetical protein FRB90_005509 [Tulasnella sp. 427]